MALKGNTSNEEPNAGEGTIYVGLLQPPISPYSPAPEGPKNRTRLTKKEDSFQTSLASKE